MAFFFAFSATLPYEFRVPPEIWPRDREFEDGGIAEGGDKGFAEVRGAGGDWGGWRADEEVVADTEMRRGGQAGSDVHEYKAEEIYVARTEMELHEFNLEVGFLHHFFQFLSPYWILLGFNRETKRYGPFVFA